MFEKVITRGNKNEMQDMNEWLPLTVHIASISYGRMAFMNMSVSMAGS